MVLRTGLIERTVVATDDPGWAALLAGLPVAIDLDQPDQPFHFGQRLAGLIERYHVQRALYIGGGSAPLLRLEDWEEILSRLAEAERLVVTNNIHSCDWVGFAPADGLVSLLARQTNDNAIAWALETECGLSAQSSPPSAATRFDLDTPADLLIAGFHPGIGPHLRRFLEGLDLDASRVEGVLSEMAQEGGSLALVGRASAAAWASLDRATRCWIRVFAEERGMRASGRMGRREVRSLLADYVAVVGIEAFCEEMATLVNGMLFDDRVILAAQGLWPSAPDRYNSDLYHWDRIAEPFLHRLTRAAAEARIPIVLGGHSVVAGGLMALVEAFELRQRTV
jgi:hypothetical protein